MRGPAGDCCFLACRSCRAASSSASHSASLCFASSAAARASYSAHQCSIALLCISASFQCDVSHPAIITLEEGSGPSSMVPALRPIGQNSLGE